MTPMELLVLDRECPLCKKTFLTNYLYNIHPCARRTRTCGGCNRPFGTETGYMRHAPHCAKIYLYHSIHILPEVAKNEAQMRIKNEYGGDVDENTMGSAPYSHLQQGNEDKDMQPVVVLERLASPLLRASGAPYTLGKNNDRVSTKSYLKRVDQLLKNTMSTLVSIKHEPEVHIDDTGPPLTAEQSESEPEQDPAPCDDFHAGAGYEESDEEDGNIGAGCSDSAATKSPNISAVAVKQELINEAYENCNQQMPSCAIKQEPFKLKLKITKNDGQLNSSLIDDEHGDHTQGLSKSAKKKKKRKHKERNKETESCDIAPPSEPESPDTQKKTVKTTEPCDFAITIKQERQDDSYSNASRTHAEFEAQATVMTSIPMLQLESRYNEKDEEATTNMRKEPEDIKPDRLELDRLMQITHIASGVVMAEEAMPPESAIEAVPNINDTETLVKPVKSTARKSTSAVKRTSPTVTDTSIDVSPLPQIVAVNSGAVMPSNIVAIKPEPLNRGYADESENCEQDEVTGGGDEEDVEQSVSSSNKKNSEEAAFIESVNLSNITIKQENDLHISDFDIGVANNLHCNGLDDVENNEDDDDADDSASSADEAEENMEIYDDQEERVYREIELQPLEEESHLESSALETQSESRIIPPELLEIESQKDNLIDLPNIENKIEEFEKVPHESEHELKQLSQTVDPQTKFDGIQETPLETSSPSTFGFVITSVCSQAEPLPVHEEEKEENSEQTAPQEKLGKCADNEGNITCPVVMLSSPKENETLAQPFSEPASTNYNCDEELQNVLNHELCVTGTEQQLDSVEEHAEVVPSAPSCSNMCVTDDQSANEETENRINEHHQEQQQQQMQQEQEEQEQVQQEQVQQEHVQQRCERNDDSNINEIAENNNNANIERELHDDANVAQEIRNIPLS